MRWSTLTLLLFSALSAQAQPLRRFAVIAGNDRGGEGTRPLLYARDDAQKIYDILRRLGGVRAEDAALLLNANTEEFLAALEKIQTRAREASGAGQRTLLLVYYSGHAKDGALRLGDSRLGFEELKGKLAGGEADLRIGIFDSCRSGMIARTKGVRRMPAFEVESDGSPSTRGLVILTSSASDEESQESDLIGGSYFSHYLASGLLGDADQSGDGRVSLSEAYAYAYERTLADTSESAAGAQHPTYSFNLAGNGDVVLTNLRAYREGILFQADVPPGTYYLVDGRGFVAAEVWKSGNIERRIGLAPGAYRIKRRLADRLRIGEIRIASGQLTTFDEGKLRDAPFSDDPVKGPGRLEQVSTHWSFGLAATYQSFFDAPTRIGLFPPAPLVGVQAEMHNFLRRNWVWEFDLAFGTSSGTTRLTGLSEPYRFSEVLAGTSILVEFPIGKWSPFGGARLALLLMTRDFDDPSLPHQSFSTFSPGLVGGVKYHLSDHFGVTAQGRVHYLLYNVDENRSLGFWELTALLSYEL